MSSNDQEIKTFTITSKKTKNPMEFITTFDKEGFSDLYFDEPTPVGQDLHPSPSGILSTAVMTCLSASITFCLSKSRVSVKGISSTGKCILARNTDAYYGLDQINYLADDQREEPLVCGQRT